MADHSKKNSMSGRPPVATPRLNQTPSNAATTMANLDTALTKVIGAKVRIVTDRPSATIEGYIAGMSTSANVIDVCERPGGLGVTNVISMSHIRDFALLEFMPPDKTAAAAGMEAGAAGGPLPLPLPSTEAIRKRVGASLARAREDEASRGKDVTQEAQDIFDSLKRIFPVRWAAKAIVVNESTVIEPPYESKDCRALEGQSDKGVKYVQRILEGERKKLADKAGRPATQSPGPGVQRKGG